MTTLSALEARLSQLGSVLLGYSGGVDSALLAVVARRALGPERFLAVIGRSASYPAAQYATATALARQFDLPLLELDTAELEDPDYRANGTDRCYFCKRELWSKLIPVARERGLAVVVDGTNADDLGGHRPGMLAAAEREVESPLAIVGMTKAEIRERSRARGMPTWSQPSAPCLSSRLPYGTRVTLERLAMVERAEEALRQLGVVGDLRVRHHGELARVELPRESIAEWLASGRLRELTGTVRSAGFARVAVDLAGFRSGSLNVLTGVVEAET